MSVLLYLQYIWKRSSLFTVFQIFWKLLWVSAFCLCNLKKETNKKSHNCSAYHSLFESLPLDLCFKIAVSIQISMEWSWYSTPSIHLTNWFHPFKSKTIQNGIKSCKKNYIAVVLRFYKIIFPSWESRDVFIIF